MLDLTLQRYQCKKCGHTFQSPIPFTKGESGYTRMFENYVLDLLRLGLTVSAVSKHLRISWHVIKDIHKSYLNKHYRNPKLKGVRYIGIDEFSVHKGQTYKTIVVDHETGRIVYVADGRSKESPDKFRKRVKRLKVKIEVVSSDLSAAYISSIQQNAPQAIHVYDRFHVVKIIADAMDKTGRAVYKQTRSLEGRIVIKGNRWLLLKKDKEALDKKYRRRPDNILETNKPLATAYYLYEDIDQVWMQKDKEQALEQLIYWCKQAEDSNL
ncbi:ISL3 family transposase, partial [Prevotella falsenii]|uniref:ISL3 family transposase n=1 Tax=Prevotella falsenii TaxID=515414 RepID=UPI001E5F5897